MAKIQAIESYDSVYTFVHIAGTLIALIYVLDGAEKMQAYYFAWIPALAQTALGFVLAIVVAMKSHKVFRLTIWPEWIPKWAYINISLRTRVLSEEAQALLFLFDGSIKGRRYSLQEITKLEKSERRNSIFRYANYVARLNGREIPFPSVSVEAGSSGTRPEEGGHQRKVQPKAMNSEIANALMLLEVYVKNPSLEDITKAYRRKIMQVHPDRNSSVSPEIGKHLEELSKQINKAYEYLQNNYHPLQ